MDEQHLTHPKKRSNGTNNRNIWRVTSFARSQRNSWRRVALLAATTFAASYFWQMGLLSHQDKRNRIRKKTFLDVSEEQTGGLMKTILVADDDEALAWRLAYTILGERRYNTLFAAGCSDVRYLVQRIIPHLLIFYSRSSPEEGLACYDSLVTMTSFTSIPTIFIAGKSQLMEQEARIRNLVLLEPPFEIDTLIDLVDQLLR